MTRAHARRLLGALFIVAGLNHFLQPRFYLVIMPDYLPAHRELVAASGYAEIGLGAMALLPRLRGLTRRGLLALLVAVFPANLHMALHPALPRHSRRKFPPVALCPGSSPVCSCSACSWCWCGKGCGAAAPGVDNAASPSR